MTFILIIVIAIILYAVAIGATWHNLGEMDKTRKIILVVFQMTIMYVFTLIMFLIRKNSIDYPNEMVETTIRRLLVLIFAGVNSILFPPLISRQINSLNDGDIDKQDFTKRMVVILAILAICLFFEGGYMKSTQEGIINIYKSKM